MPQGIQAAGLPSAVVPGHHRCLSIADMRSHRQRFASVGIESIVCDRDRFDAVVAVNDKRGFTRG